jgi:hypothetical protein
MSIPAIQVAYYHPSDGRLLGTFASCTDAADAMGTSSGQISRALTKPHQTSTGYYWRAFDGTEPLAQIELSEYQLKRSKKILPGEKNSVTRPIAQYTPDGKLVAVFDNQTLAAQAVGVKPPQINRCVRNPVGKYTAAGFAWVSTIPGTDIPETIATFKVGTNIAVASYDPTTGALKGVYDSKTAAEQAHGLPFGSITLAIQDAWRAPGDLLWREIKDKAAVEDPIILPGDRPEYPGRGIKVEQTDLDGNHIAWFGSLAEAGEAMGVTRERIRQCVRYGRVTKNSRWREV